MTLNNESKFFAGTFIITLVLVVIGLFFFNQNSTSTTNTTPTPTVSKEELITTDTPTTGNKDAKVYLVEFSDFQCPACKAFQPVVKGVIEKNKDNLLFAYRYFPLVGIHPQALNSAQAGAAAHKQAKFWEMHDLLFDNQSSLASDLYLKLAGDLKLDETKFQADFASAKDYIQSELTFSNSIGITSTPTFFLNGQKLTLTSPAQLATLVEEAINKSGE